MESVPFYQDPSWWIFGFILGLLINVFSNALYRFSAKIFSSMAEKRKLKSFTKAKKLMDTEVPQYLNNDYKFQSLNTNLINWNVTWTVSVLIPLLLMNLVSLTPEEIVKIILVIVILFTTVFSMFVNKWYQELKLLRNLVLEAKGNTGEVMGSILLLSQQPVLPGCLI